MKFASFVGLFGKKWRRPELNRDTRSKSRRARKAAKTTRLAVESLEDRTLMSVLPAANTVVPQFLPVQVQNQGQNEVAPAIAVDPINPQKLVAVYTVHAPQPAFNANSASEVSRIAGNFSSDGGKTWSPLPFPPTKLIDPTSVFNQEFKQATDASVAIDRNENVYVVYSEHSNNLDPSNPVACNAGTSFGNCVSGVVVLQKFNINDAALGSGGPSVKLSDNVLYRWTGQEPVMSPTVAVDNTVPFTDPDTGAVQASGSPGAVYVAWNTNFLAPGQFAQSTAFNPNVIQMIASGDGGITFTDPMNVSDGDPAAGSFFGVQRNATPQIVVSEGRPGGATPGQVNLVWTQWDEQGAPGNPTNPRIVSDYVLPGAKQAGFGSSTLSTTILDARQNYTINNNTPTRVQPDTPQSVTLNQSVNITDPTFNITHLEVTVSIEKPNVQDLSLLLVPPKGPSIPLLLNAQGPNGNLVVPAQGIQNATAANIGFLNGVVVGTIFDQSASKSITDPQNQPPYAARFTPEQGSLNALISNPNFQANGVWKLVITDNRSEGPDRPCGATSCAGANTGTLHEFVIRFSSGNTTNNPDVVVPGSGVLGAFYFNNRTIAASDHAFPTSTRTAKPAASPDLGIFPAPVLAVDNTLGSFSPYQGRLYTAFVGSVNDAADIFLATSDDGGKSWKLRRDANGRPLPVNDDGPLDGFSAGNRPQFLPTIAVDPTTGTLVVTYYDARFDAAEARVARMIATSVDGGATFGPQTFLNAPNAPKDAITGNNVVLGPLPDNQSAGSAQFRDLTFSFGARQGLAVASGHVYAAWSGNEDVGLLGILVSASPTAGSTTIAAGPRITSSDMGPVIAPRTTPVGGLTYDTTVAPDGTLLPDGIVLTFDRPLTDQDDNNATGADPAGLDKSDVSVFFRSPDISGNSPGIPLLVTKIIALDAGSTFGPVGVKGATQFLVRFDPRKKSDGSDFAGPYTGTYSYMVGPNIRDRIRTVDATGALLSPGDLMDQNMDAATGLTPGDIYANPRPANLALSFRDGFFHPGFVQETPPLSVPGPYIVKTSVPNGQPGSSDNLVLNSSVTAIDVTFDRDIDPTSVSSDTFTLEGPQGIVSSSVPYAITPNPSGTDAAGHIRTFRIGLPVAQILSGTYTVTIGPFIRAVNRPVPGSKDGDLDTNLNAGIDSLRDVVPAASLVTTPDKFVSSNVPVAIGAGAKVTSLLDVDEIFTIQGATLQLSLNTTSPSDFSATLIAPFIDPTTNAPMRIPLFNKVPSSGGANFTNTIFDDSASLSIQAGVPPFPGSYRPLGKLAALNNHASLGESSSPLNPAWQLEIVNSGGTTGTLTNWSLSFARPVASIRNKNTNPFILTAGQTVRSPITVTDAFTVQGATVSLDILALNDPDLSATLVAPDGTRVLLFSNVGNTGNRQNFSATVFDDAARNRLATTPITNGGPPFFGRFNPMQPLGTLNGHSSQVRDAAGNLIPWQLEITNKGSLNARLNYWSLNLLQAVPTFGLGEANADRGLAHFRIFTMDPANLASHEAWTAVGPASSNQIDPATGKIVPRGVSGQIGAIAADPSDPSGNTVFVAGATGGIWKTTNFLTTDPNGPTYIPIADFGPTFAINIGNLTVIGRNNNPDRSLVIAATGTDEVSIPNLPAGMIAAPGTGLILSQDGGATWNLFDSTDNTLPFSLRDHKFVGTAGYKVLADPQPSPLNEAIIYMALSDPTDRAGTVNGKSGLWRSIDSGKHWTLLRQGDATDVVLDENSGYFDAISNPTGNLQIIYAGFRGEGIFRSPDRGQTWYQMFGGVNDPTINSNPNGTGGTVVNAPQDVPNAVGKSVGRIVLAKPDLVPASDPNAYVKNLLYEGWLFALVATPGGGNDGLYVTKDFGQNWTRVETFTSGTLINGQGNAVPIPTNNSNSGQYSPLGAGNGNIDISMAVDPTNPNVVYIGGTLNGLPSNLIRVDMTAIADARAFFLSYDRPDGGQLRSNIHDPTNAVLGTGYLNVIQNPNDPFNTDSAFTLDPNVFGQARTFGPLANNGFGAHWIPFDRAVAPDPFDPTSDPTVNQHRIFTYRDPLTGHARLILGDDEGVFTAVDRGDGTLIGSISNTGDFLNTKNGNVPVVSGTRNGNLQLTQMFHGASQPSDLAAQIAGALLYATTQNAGLPSSDPNLLNNGNITWTGAAGIGGGIAADQVGTGTSYQSLAPAFPTISPPGLNFFQVNGVGRTFGLLQGINDPEWPGNAAFNFAVNPIDGDDIVISSDNGTVFATTTQGRFWQVIAQPVDLQSNTALAYARGVLNAPALAYGAPDPGSPAGGDAINFPIYAGLNNGHIWVTFSGGGSSTSSGTALNKWFDLTNGDLATDLLAAASPENQISLAGIRAIVTSPTRGSHEAYAVTRNGVYHIVNSDPNSNVSPADKAWIRISGNLKQVVHNVFVPFNDPTQPISSDSQLKDFRLETIAADWRYTIPDDPGNPKGPTHPILYVGGEGGVFRSIDGGKTWTLYPHQNTDPVNDQSPNDGVILDGGFLPNAHITDLQIALGNVNQTNDRARLHDTTNPDPNRQPVGPDILYATTFGRGAFAIRLAPVIMQAQQIQTVDAVRPIFGGISEQTAFGNRVRITLWDLTDPNNRKILGGFNPADPSSDTAINWTDGDGNFRIQVNSGSYKLDGSTDGPKVYGLQASDDAGAVSEMIKGTFVLDTTPLVIANTLRLDPKSDSGVSNTDGITNVVQPVILGSVQQALPVIVQLVDMTTNTNPDDPRFIIGVGQTDANGQIVHVDPTTGALVPGIQVNPGVFKSDGSTDGVKILGIRATNGNKTSTGRQTIPTIRIVLDTSAPVVPTIDLAAFSDTGTANNDHVTRVNTPTFTGKGEAGARVRVFAQNVTGGPVVQINVDPTNPDIADAQGNYGAFTRPTALADGTYFITADEIDTAGNVSGRSQPLQPLLIVSTLPITKPTLTLDASSDTGVVGDNITAAIPQAFDGTTIAGSAVVVVDTKDGVTTTFGPFDSTQLNVVQQKTVDGVTAFYKQLDATHFQVSLSLTDGVHVLSAMSTNVAGATASSAPLTTTIDRNALDADRKFIRQLYSLALGRTGSLTDWNYWIPFLSLPNGRQVIASQIEHSQEARTVLVKGWYIHYLGRSQANPTTNGEEQYWVGLLLAGVTEEDVLSSILGSLEYYNHASQVAGTNGGVPTDTTFIQALYSQLLKRPASAADLAFWLPIVPVVDRTLIVKTFLTSLEYRTEVVASYYNGYPFPELNILHRPTPPTAAEFYYWVLSPLDFVNIRIGFESSEEFYMRVGGLRL